MVDAVHLAVDLSSNNPLADMAAYFNAGHRVVIIKATEGHTYLNPQYQQEVDAAHNVGLVVWHYHYLRGNGALEAPWFLQNVLPHMGPLDRFVVDFEESDATAESCVAFQSGIDNAPIIHPQTLVYGSPATIHSRGLPARASWDLWEAQYNGSISWPDAIPGWPSAIAWQFTSTGQIEGVPDNSVDLSILTDAAMPSFVPPPASPVTPAPQGDNDMASKAPATVQNGTKGQDARNVQGLLCAAGRTVTIDGDFGPKSTAALTDWQRAAGLVADGICGPRSWSRFLGIVVV